MEATQNTAIKIVLNRRVQVVTPATNKAFRLADMHNNAYEESPVLQYRLKNIFNWPMFEAALGSVYTS